MASGSSFRPSAQVALALALAVTLLGAASVQAKSDDPDPDEVPATVRDAGAKAAIAAALKARAQTVVVTRFAVASDVPANHRDLSARGCPAPARPAPAQAGPAKPAAVLDPKILDVLTNQIAKRLAKKVTVSPQRNADKAPMNAVIVTGCITRFEAGNAAKRFVGMHYGASRIAAHVRILQKVPSGVKPIVEYDVAVTGGNLLPPLSPIGLALNVATMNLKTLSADARKLGNRISNKFEDTFIPEED